MQCDLYCEDNLILLQRLDSEIIDLVYCDVLYGTGNKFKDFIDIQPKKQDVYEFYQLRFAEIYRILKDSGTLYIQCDLRIVHWLRCILDDIFGYDNFRNQIVIKYNIGGYGKKQFPKKHDLLIVYTKSDIFTFNDLDIRIPYKSVISKKQDRPNITKEKLELGTVPTNVWDDIPSGLRVKKKTSYYSEKHEKILERIIKCSSNPGDLIADFFLGSGTTASVCQKLNRNFIGCDINPNSIQITKERLNEFRKYTLGGKI